MRELTLGSLFDGAGGFPFAAQHYGIKPIWASEIEKFPIEVTKKNFPEMKHLGDVSKINGADIDPVDVITFGSPCQDLSTASTKRQGLAGGRSGLFHEAIRIIKEMRIATNGIYPRIAVWENVEGARSSNKGEDFRCVLEEFCKISQDDAYVPKPQKWGGAGHILGNGYSVAWRVLDARFHGVPQRRRRVFLVASFGSERAAGEILFKRGGLSRTFATIRKSWKGATKTFAFCSSSSSERDRRGNNGEDVSTTIDNPYVVALDYSSFNQGANAKYNIGIDECGTTFTCRAKHSGGGAVFYCTPSKLTRWGGKLETNQASTLTTGGGDNTPTIFYFCKKSVVLRRLTPTECGRLQGMPDWWCDGIPHSDAAEYKLWGNGMALPCVLYVMEGVKEVLENDNSTEK